MMYTTETSTGSNSIATQRQVSPETNHYLLPVLSFEGGIFKEQQTIFLTRLVLPNLFIGTWSTKLKAVSLFSCGLCCFAVLPDRRRVFLGEHPGLCVRSMHAMRTQCNNLALVPGFLPTMPSL